MERIQKITRKDGITYERKRDVFDYNKRISIRVNEDILNNFKTVATINGYKYQELIRNLMEEYINENRQSEA